MTKSLLSSAVAIGVLLGGCGEPTGDQQSETPGPRDPATVLELYAQAINSRSYPDYLALHVDGFVVERLDEGRYCMPWLDEGWWQGGPLPPECSDVDLREVSFVILDQRAEPDRPIEVTAAFEMVFLVGPDTGWLREGRVRLHLVEIDGVLLIERVMERRIL